MELPEITRLQAYSVAIASVVVLLAGCRTIKKKPPGRYQAAGPPALIVESGRYKSTVVTPYLEHRIQKGQNVIFCATAQLAWNELSRLLGEPVRLNPEPEMAVRLNSSTVSRKDLDDDSYVAMAGFGSDGIVGRIRNEIRTRFGAKTRMSFLPGTWEPPSDGLVAYAYMFKNLPFRWTFERLKDPFSFAGEKVESFGLSRLAGRKRQQAASQVRVYDAHGESSFIVELMTRSKQDRLLLAKVAPEETMADTIKAVLARVSSSKPAPMIYRADLRIPVLNFEIVKSYDELYSIGMASRNPRFNGLWIDAFLQAIRFKLEETGAVVESSSMAFVFGKVNDLDFDRPFLVLLMKKDASQPYFALWVGNAELLVPFGKKK